ncbi:MAG: hypothetical protein M1813_003435 [Trichoglossum hirsutum]|nr:MAG: hypothetical protein M1813_003435 [Trichoglossum hirsutum]
MDSRSRNEVFSSLKPACVDLIQVTLSFSSNKSSANSVVRSLRVLLEALKKDSQYLDSTLGDYVFFPLSHVFRQSQLLPERAVELALNCLAVLLLSCWNQNVSSELAAQLAILLTFVAGGRPAQVDSTGASEELKVAAFRCLANLFNAMASSKGKSLPNNMTNQPALGHALSTVLDAIVNGGSPELQLDALGALEAYQLCAERETLADVLPGIVSSLTKCLRPTTSTRRPYRVLERGLQVLSVTLKFVFADSQFKLAPHGVGVTSQQLKDKEPRLSDSWLKASATQVKLALTGVVKLRNHEKAAVRRALLQLSLVILEDCRQSLSTAAGVMVETLIVLSEDSSLEGRAALKRLTLVDHNTVELVQSSMHAWVVALPRLMQSNDDDARRGVIKQLSTSFSLFSEIGRRSEILENSVAASLRDSVSTGLQVDSARRLVQQTDDQLDVSIDQLQLGTGPIASMNFQPLLLNHKSHEGTLQDLELFLQQLGGSDSSLAVAREQLNHMHNASGDDLLACFWLSIKLLQKTSEENLLLEDMVHVGSSTASVRAQLAEELYSFALTLLLGSVDDSRVDWRLHGLALEVLALEAQRLGSDFRLEFVEALYPLVFLIGSSNEDLRNHAFTSLNITAQACGYTSASDMLVDNVDYLVNAVSLKLNTFSISPQAPKVLLMMIKLTGPSLLPFLDDLVGSIFAALDSFHGYPRLVALLFSVLEGIVDEGSKAIVPALGSGTGIGRGGSSVQARTVPQLCTMLEDSKRRLSKPLACIEGKASQKISTELRERSGGKETLTDNVAGRSMALLDGNEGRLPTTGKVYQMVQKIARFVQHYLAHESPIFRRQLLGLLTTACGSLYGNDNEFLPLINDIWPVTIKRLYDNEHFVVIAAAEAICQICKCAGDFMSSRIHTEWRNIKDLYNNTQGKLQIDTKQLGIRIFTPGSQVRNALVKLLMAIVEYVRIDSDIFDDILNMLSDMLESRKDIRDALSLANADAVWLDMWAARIADSGVPRNLPQVEGFAFEPVIV